jgi:CelD/BcsL family acetyltransferase involved in cellulose biosynthesis
LTQSPDAFDLPEWGALIAADHHRHIVSLPEWNRAWWEEFGGGKKLFVLTFLDPEPVGLAPLTLDVTERGSRLRFLGGDDLTDYLGPLVSSHDYDSKIADALVQYLSEDLRGWDYFDAKCLPVPFHFAEWLVEAADRHGFDFRMDQDEVTAVVDLPDSYDAYLAALSRRRRHELKRKSRRFEEAAPQSRITRASDENINADVITFVEMHRFSGGLKGKFMKPERATFFTRVAQAFHPKGWLSMDFLEIDGRRIAGTFGFTFEGVFYLYNSAYDPELKRLSPGLILVSRLIERSIEEGFARFDLLKGRERYKFDLGAKALPLHSVEIRAPSS